MSWTWKFEMLPMPWKKDRRRGFGLWRPKEEREWKRERKKRENKGREENERIKKNKKKRRENMETENGSLGDDFVSSERCTPSVSCNANRFSSSPPPLLFFSRGRVGPGSGISVPGLAGPALETQTHIQTKLDTGCKCLAWAHPIFSKLGGDDLLISCLGFLMIILTN